MGFTIALICICLMTNEVKYFPTHLSRTEILCFVKGTLPNLFFYCVIFLMDFYGFSLIPKCSPLLVIDVQIFRLFFTFKGFF